MTDKDYWKGVAEGAEKSRNEKVKKSAAYNARWRAQARRNKSQRRKKR